jgi:hypothetical protein
VTEGEGQRAGSVWRNRPFLWYWCGGAVTSTGTWIQNVTASVLMYQLTGSSLMVGVLNFANFAPVFALSIVGGVLSDRLDRRFLIVTTHVFSAIVAVGIAALTLTGAITPLLLIVGVALIGSSHAISKPTLSSLLPSLVPRHMIARASAVNVLQFNMGQGPGVDRGDRPAGDRGGGDRVQHQRLDLLRARRRRAGHLVAVASGGEVDPQGVRRGVRRADVHPR